MDLTEANDIEAARPGGHKVIAGYETHPAADLFPMMEPEELEALADDIKAHGLHNPVTLYTLDGKRQILDGRNRARACEMAGVKPSFEPWDGEGSPVEWVVSQNLHRRHLTTSQRATIAAGLAPMFEKEAHERQVAALRQGDSAPVAANLQHRGEGRSTAKAAKAMQVSERLVASAVKVQREAPAEVVAAVRKGEMTVHAAEKQIPARPEKKKPGKKEEDWNVTLTLTLPHSALREVKRALQHIGFVGAGHRKMKRTRGPAATAGATPPPPPAEGGKKRGKQASA